MRLYRWTLFSLVPLALILCACQPVMPVETPVPEEVPTHLSDLPGEILIPAGPFQMGCDVDNPQERCRDDELPLHTVYLDAYYIDEFEVTNARYLACVDAGVCAPPKLSDSLTRDVYFDDPDFADYPVVYMDWYKAYDFCAWEGKRLPTEAEWVKAARGPDDTRKYPWGDADPSCEFANFWEGTNGCVGDTSAVGSFPAGASPYGVMDMAGNVSEWVNDWYAEDYYSVSPTDNPQGPATGTYRMDMGGTWFEGIVSLDIIAHRKEGPHESYHDHGLRCAHSP